MPAHSTPPGDARRPGTREYGRDRVTSPCLPKAARGLGGSLTPEGLPVAGLHPALSGPTAPSSPGSQFGVRNCHSPTLGRNTSKYLWSLGFEADK